MLLGEHSLQVEDPNVPGEREGEGRRKSTATAPWDPRVKSSSSVCTCLDVYMDVQKKGLKRSQLATFRLQVPRVSRPPRSTWLTIQLPPSPLEVQKGDLDAKNYVIPINSKQQLKSAKPKANTTKNCQIWHYQPQNSNLLHKRSYRETKDATQWTLILRLVKKTRTL